MTIILKSQTRSTFKKQVYFLQRNILAFEIRERNPSFVLGILCIIACPMQLIREVF